MAGFGSDHQLHTTRLVDLATRLPVKVEFIETAHKVEELLAKLQTMVGTGLIEMHDTTIVKPAETKKAQAAVPGKPALRRKNMFMLGCLFMGVFGFVYIALLNTGIPVVIFIAIALSLLPVMTEYGRRQR